MAANLSTKRLSSWEFWFNEVHMFKPLSNGDTFLWYTQEKLQTFFFREVHTLNDS